jgi:Tfp pilus assembly protein PilN
LRPLNLATQPFRNERLPTLLCLLLALVVLGVSVGHVVTAVRVMPASLGRVEGERQQLESELAALDKEGATLREVRPSKADYEEWTALRELVDRRLFQWSVLLDRLASIVPSDVQLTAIEPQLDKRGLSLRIDATTASSNPEIFWKLARRLEAEPDFRDVVPQTIDPATGTNTGLDATFEMRYAAAPASPTPEGAPEEAPSAAPEEPQP